MNTPTDTAPWLVLDASHPDVYVGVLGKGRWITLEHDHAPALNSLFRLTDRCLEAAGFSLSELGGFVHCSGPGSMLGIRLGAMAIKTWRTLYPKIRLYSYTSLDLARRSLLNEMHGTPFSLIADWKKNTWHLMSWDSDTIGITTADEVNASKDSKLFYLSQRKGWQAPPEHAIPVAYTLKDLPNISETDGAFLSPNAEPIIFQHEEPKYKKWEPSRHGR